jgi:hypothetical protein
MVIRRLAPAALLAAAACARPAELRVIVDSTAAPGAVEVLATPFDPAGLIPTNPARESADSLDALFQRERRALNARSAVLDTMDRRTPAYAADHAELTARIGDAERLRAARDSAARRAGPRRGIAPAALDSASRAAGRPVARAPIAAGGVTIRLQAGAWWITLLDPAGAVLLRALRVELKADGRDTSKVGVAGDRSR